jgi:outer membrane biosynthesis protein TonB
LKNIPQEIDELMWTIAESGDDTAVVQFCERHPSYRSEMIRRVQSMTALVNAGKTKRQDVPVFKPKEAAPIQFKSIYWVAGLCGALLLGVFGYAITRPTPSQPLQVQNEIIEGPKPELMTEGNQPPKIEQKPEVQEQKTPEKEEPKPPSPEAPVVSEPNEGKTDINIESSTLHAAIQLVAASGGIAVTIAPGLPNPDVQVKYEEMTPLEVLKEMGKDYAFAVVEDGEKQVIVLPLKDDVPSNKGDANRTD